MRHFTQRLMLVAMLAIASICNVWADDLAVGTYSYNPYSATYYYGFTSASDCQLTVSFSGDWNYASFSYAWSDDNGSSWGAGSGEFKSSIPSQTFNISAGKTYALYLGNNWSSSLTMTVSSTCGGSGPTPPTAQPGENPENAIELSVGNSTKDVLSGKDTWYKISVPAGYCVKYSVSYMLYGNTTKMYAGKANADAKTNAIGSSNSGGADSGQGDNTTSGAVDYYICLQANAVYGSPNFTVSLEDLGSINDAKSIGTLQFDIANKANVGIATSSVLVTFPSFVGGALSEYNMAVLYTVNELTDEWNNYGSVMGYYRVVANGTASAGVQLPLPTLVDGKKYQVRVDRVDVTNGNLGKDFSSANSVSFAATNIPDGTEGNPFIITEAGVAGPDHSATYGNWTWYKYTVPSDGKVTISHTWSNTSINTTGFIRVNGEQVRSNVPDVWEQGCSTGDVVMVAMATEAVVSSYLVKGSVSEPGDGDIRSMAIALHEGSNSIARVNSGELTKWYTFTVPANYEGTLTFSEGVAAKYYIGSSVTGTNISNNEDGQTELVYTNESAGAVDIYVEVSGTNDHTPTATLVLEDQTPAPVDATFTSALNNGNANGSVVSALENAFFLQAGGLVGAASDNSKFHMMKDDMWLADAVFSYDDNNQAAVIFGGSGFSEAGVYKLIVDAGAATIGGVACEATSFTWTIGGGSASDCDAPMADDKVSFASAKSGEAVAGAAGITMMDRDFEITCLQSGLTRYNSSVGVKLDMPWAGSTYDITSYIRNWEFNCEKITFTLSYDLDYSLLSSAGEWKLYIYENSFQGETSAIYSSEKTFTWTVAPAVVYNNPTITGATNSGEAAGSKVTMLSEDFYITLSEASNYRGYGVSYQYNGATDFDASVSVTMNDNVAKVTVSGVDLSREGEHAINVTYGAFVNANDETKELTVGQKLNWYIGDYAIIGANADGVEPGSDEIDNKMFKNAFYLSLNYPSTPKSSFSVKLKKDGVDFLTSTAKPTKMDGAGKEWKIVFSSWPKVNYSYAALEPGVYTLELPAGAFTNDLIGGESTAAYNVSWNVIHMVYPWSLVTSAHTTPVLAGSKAPGAVNEKFSHVFNVTFDGKYSNVAQGAGAITLVRDELTIAENPVVVISGNTATITFGDEDFGVDGVYTLNIAEGAFTATYTQDGDDTPSNNVNCSSSSFTWNVTVPAVVYNAPNIVSATNGGNAAGTTVNEVAQDFIVTLSEESAYVNYGVYYQFSDDETAPVTDFSANVSVSMNADKTLATIHVESAKLSLNGRHVIYITAGAFVNANDETKALATGATFTWTREGVETFDITLTADGYASFCWDKNWIVPADVTIYKATAQDGEMVLIQEVSGVIPAYKGVILYAPGETQVIATATEDEAISLDDNILKGTTVLTVNPATISSVTVYAMHYVGESTNATVFDSYTGANIPANKAYIQLGAGAPARLRVAMAGNTTTGMEAAATANGGVSKRLVNGQLFILRDGKMYNVQGVKL